MALQASHAVRRLTDESTNENCTPPGRRNPASGVVVRQGYRPPLDGLPRPQARSAVDPAHLSPRSLVAAALSALVIGGCGGGDNPVEVQLEEKTAEQTVLGFPALATKNTTRVGGEDPVADAAGGRHAPSIPAQTRGSRPRAVTLVDQRRLARRASPRPR